jgi:MFS family permease
LFLGSFGDEAAQVTFALRLTDGPLSSPSQISALLGVGLVGGIISGPISARLMPVTGVRRMLSGIFVAEALLIGLASTVSTIWWYLAIALVLGCLGSMLWSAVMVGIPALALSDPEIDRINRFVQSVRNLGYVVGPLVGSTLFTVSSGTGGLLWLALLMLSATVGVFASTRVLIPAAVGRGGPPTGRKGIDVMGFLRTPRVLRALLPLIVTVLVTSALNVLLIIRIRSDLNLDATAYGSIVTGVSVGLVLGPVFLGSVAGMLGEPSGASLAAAVIGAAIIALGTLSTPWQMVTSAVFVGVANGVQNTLM